MGEVMVTKEKLDRLKRLKELHDEKDAMQSYFDKLTNERDNGALKNLYGIGEDLFTAHVSEVHQKISVLQYGIEEIAVKADLPEDIKCPHCGYVHKISWRENTLRVLSLVLQPRYIKGIDCRNGKFIIGDVEESFDQFDNISDTLDGDYTTPDDDGSYAKVREFARGKMIFLCDKCLGYFDGSQYRMQMIEDFCHG